MDQSQTQSYTVAPETLMRDFDALCDCGGRFVGTDSERMAVDLLMDTIGQEFGRAPDVFEVPYDGWRRIGQRLERLTPTPQDLDCHALVWSPQTPPGGLEAEVVDLGRGTPDDILRHAGQLAGRIALVRHEYMFSTETIHRRLKYDTVREHGAVGFLIASHLSGEKLVTGSSGRSRPDDIPAAAITLEGGESLATAGREFPRVRLIVEVENVPGQAESLILSLPGQSPEWVVLSAHIDGHPLAESAMDNATGLAAALAVARAMAPRMHEMTRGLRLCLFNLEEWALAGSGVYVDGLPDAERAAIAFNLNLDSVAGDARLTALTSGYRKIESFLQPIAQEAGIDLGFHEPLMRNSDHYHFARHGVPACRLVAGFNDPDSFLRYVLTPEDKRDKIDPQDLQRAADLALSIVAAACRAPSLDLRS